MKLVLLRHAKSSWEHDLPDHERPLSGRGRRDAPRIGRRIVEAGFAPQHVIASDSARTRETFSRMREELGDPPVSWRRSLYGASARTLFEELRGERAGRVLALGHNPGWEEALERLGYDEPLTTCNAALLESPAASWPEALAGPWELCAILRPRPPRS